MWTLFSPVSFPFCLIFLPYLSPLLPPPSLFLTHTCPESKYWTPVSRFSVSFMQQFPDYSRPEKKNKYIKDLVSQVPHRWSASYSSGKLQNKEGPPQCGPGVQWPAMSPQWSVQVQACAVHRTWKNSLTGPVCREGLGAVTSRQRWAHLGPTPWLLNTTLPKEARTLWMAISREGEN